MELQPEETERGPNDFYYVKIMDGDLMSYCKILYPDGSLLLDCAVTEYSAKIIIPALNNLVLISEAKHLATIGAFRFIGERFICDLDRLKPHLNEIG